MKGNWRWLKLQVLIPAFFDDCVFGTNVDPSLGKQPEPFDGWYAWAWSPNPGHTMVADPTTWFRLEKYVKDVIVTFENETAVLAWDLFNEPNDKSLLLVRKVFNWAREVNNLPWGHRPGDGPYNRRWQHNYIHQILKCIVPMNWNYLKPRSQDQNSVRIFSS